MKKMQKAIPLAVGLTLLFSGSAFAASPEPSHSVASSSKIAAGDYQISFDQASIASNVYVQNLLGLTKNELLKRLQTGESLEDIAEDEGVDTDDLLDALLQASGNKMAAAVKEGELTSQEYENTKTGLRDQLTDFLDKQVPSANTNANNANANTNTNANTSAAAQTSSNASSHRLNQAAYLLGLSKSEVEKQTEAGKSIAQLAKERGIDSGKVVNGVVYAEKLWIAEQLKKPWTGTSASTSEQQQEFKDNGYLAKAASLLGLTETQLAARLKAGATVEQLAKERGIDLSKITSGLVSLAQERISKAVNTQGGHLE
ncbi:hypothetical protein [Cohnella fermenti]|uniref:LysM domain-containing protein n=1 Tax=Cohnella fermenti TaxID=2565925 RepID=A0A4S4BUJ3_9BACL|nr:hypothetical protein [Cohnella fermenti]THF78777.1 hypothetical protein E6C55_13730 [Cohnella fermenti]